MTKKQRIDLLLVSRGLAPSRERAQALILSGNVLVADQPVTKSGQEVSLEAEVRVRGEDHPYVSRGGLKLRAALDAFAIDVSGRTALDVGASTGGFTQVLLLAGAKRVHAVDVGQNQLAWEVRKDPRVVVYEKTNARALTKEILKESVSVVVADVSFISLEKVIPPTLALAEEASDWITLIKPQFEVGREKVGKGGIVRSEEDRQEAILQVTRAFETLGLVRRGLIDSPITGTQGNQEYLAHWTRGSSQKRET